MRILVCVKQVPSTEKVAVDPETGVLLRAGFDARMNPYDEYAIEAALYIRGQTGARVAALTMGTPHSEAVLREAFSFGVNEGYLLTDRQLAGSDVLATSYALSQAVRVIGPFDLIICGRQTTDGDTAQVGPALAEQLDIPHVSWVQRIVKAGEYGITVEQDMLNLTANAEMSYPCLITVEKGIFQPRLPSYTLMKKTKDYPIKRLSLNDFTDKNPGRYGLRGSPTNVERMFPPETGAPPEVFRGSGSEVADAIFDRLLQRKLIYKD